MAYCEPKHIAAGRCFIKKVCLTDFIGPFVKIIIEMSMFILS